MQAVVGDSVSSQHATTSDTQGLQQHHLHLQQQLQQHHLHLQQQQQQQQQTFVWQPMQAMHPMAWPGQTVYVMPQMMMPGRPVMHASGMNVGKAPQMMMFPYAMAMPPHMTQHMTAPTQMPAPKRQKNDPSVAPAESAPADPMPLPVPSNQPETDQEQVHIPPKQMVVKSVMQVLQQHQQHHHQQQESAPVPAKPQPATTVQIQSQPLTAVCNLNSWAPSATTNTVNSNNNGNTIPVQQMPKTSKHKALDEVRQVQQQSQYVEQERSKAAPAPRRAKTAAKAVFKAAAKAAAAREEDDDGDDVAADSVGSDDEHSHMHDEQPAQQMEAEELEEDEEEDGEGDYGVPIVRIDPGCEVDDLKPTDGSVPMAGTRKMRKPRTKNLVNASLQPLLCTDAIDKRNGTLTIKATCPFGAFEGMVELITDKTHLLPRPPRRRTQNM